MAAYSLRACFDKTWFWEGSGDKKRGEKSYRGKITCVHIPSELQRTECSGTAWSSTSSTMARHNNKISLPVISATESHHLDLFPCVHYVVFYIFFYFLAVGEACVFSCPVSIRNCCNDGNLRVMHVCSLSLTSSKN